MTGHFTDADLERYLGGALTPEALLDADDHLAVCPDCRSRLAARRDPGPAMRAALAGLTADEHATDEAIEGYVRGTLDHDARSRFEAHAAECPTCAQAMEDLRLWAGSAAPRGVTPADAPAAAASAAAASRMRWYALAASIVLALSLPLGYWWQSTHGEAAGLRGLASLAPDVQARVREAIRGGEIALPADIAALAGQPETLMGTATTPPFHLVTPVAVGVVQDRPVLAWEPLAGADRYVVAVADDQGRPVVRGLEVRGPAVTLPEPLPRGRVYSWQVTAHRGADAITEPAPPQPAARFKVLDAETAAALRTLEQAQPDSHVLLGLLYLEAGAVDDARRHLRAVPADDPQRALAERTLARMAPTVTRPATP